MSPVSEPSEPPGTPGTPVPRERRAAPGASGPTDARATPGELGADQAAQLGKLLDVHPEARELGERFAAAGHELYLVGGSVRDTLLAGSDDRLDADTIDLDFATSARPEETERLLRGWADAIWLTGAAFGTVSCQRQRGDAPARIVEITTFRADTYVAGSRHPSVEFGDRIEDDLARRDFTVNAMAVRVPDFAFVDPHGGIGDLQRRVLVTPIDPRVSFGDDPLRMVRMARFVSVLDAQVEETTLAAATDMVDELATVSAERIREELIRLMRGRAPARGIDLLVRTHLVQHVIPELSALAVCVDPEHRHKDVYQHTLAVLDNAIALEDDGPDLVLRLAALLHDLGKPQTREIHRDGTVTFHHHDVVGARMVRQRMRELRFDKETVKAVSELVRLHLRFHTYQHGWSDSAVRRYVRDAGDVLRPLNLLTRADVTTGNARRAQAIQQRVTELEERIDHLRAQEELDALRPAIDGRRIMEHLGIAPGPEVGEAWQFLLELRIERGPMEDDDALAELDAWWASRGGATTD
jgi:poly(A) polymerase